MHPVLFHIGPIAVPTYGLLTVLAFLAALLLVRRYAGVEGLDRQQTVDALFYTMVAGFVGARLTEAIVHWERFAAAPMTLAFSTGTFMGGLICALVFVVLWFRRIGMPFLLGLDLLALVVACLLGIGRWGCFASGCCWGTPTDLPWAVTFPELARQIHAGLPDVPLHPTQIYLSINSLLILGVLVLLYRRKRFHGQIMMTYLMIYGVTRALLSFLRGDSMSDPVVAGLLNRSQLLSLAVAAAAAVSYFLLARRHRLSGAADWQAASGAAAATAPERKRKGSRRRGGAKGRR